MDIVVGQKRWFAEWINLCFNRFARLLIRLKKESEKYYAMLYLGCPWITFIAAGLFKQALS